MSKEMMNIIIENKKDINDLRIAVDFLTKEFAKVKNYTTSNYINQTAQKHKE